MESIEIIKKMSRLHCARGPKRCNTCKEYMDEGRSFALVRIFLTSGNIARPITDFINANGEKTYGEYDIIQRFDNIEEAKQYAEENNVELINE